MKRVDLVASACVALVVFFSGVVTNTVNAQTGVPAPQIKITTPQTVVPTDVTLLAIVKGSFATLRLGAGLVVSQDASGAITISASGVVPAQTGVWSSVAAPPGNATSTAWTAIKPTAVGACGVLVYRNGIRQREVMDYTVAIGATVSISPNPMYPNWSASLDLVTVDYPCATP